MFRRGFGRPLRRFPADIPPALQRANELLATGNYPGAAVAFEQLARAAEARRGPRAAWLYLQAGRARLLNDQSDQGVALLLHGLGLFAARGEWALLARSGQGTVAELRQEGRGEAADQVEGYLQAALPAGSSPAPEAAARPRPPLPASCPGCGALLRPDEAAWIDAVTAECPYCGSAVRAEDRSPRG